MNKSPSESKEKSTNSEYLKAPHLWQISVFISLGPSWVGVANCYDFLNHVYCKKKKTNEVPKHS